MTSDPLFLEHIAISNFRAYPLDFEVHLPPGPGVTVLSGPNGLGKTSLFEAIEWALTADVKRLSAFTKKRLDGRYLLRRESGASCEVSLVFTGGVHIRRLQTVGGVVSVVGTERDEVAEAIRVPDSRWMVSGGNVAEYLHLTHFHPQAAELRLVSEKPGERWVRISPLAGADRFDRFRANLRNARTGLTRVIERREEVVRSAIEREESWVRRVEQLKTLSAVDRAARGALSPHDALGVVAPIAHLMQRAVPSVHVGSGAAVADLLAHLRNDLERATDVVESKESQLRSLANMPSTWIGARATHLSAVERHSGASARLQVASELEATTGIVAAERAIELRRATAGVSQAEQRHRLAVSLQMQEVDLDRIVGHLLALKEVSSRLEESASAAQAEVQRHAVAQRQLQSYEAARKVAQESISSVKAALLSLAESRDLAVQLGRQNERISQRASQLENLRKTVVTLDGELGSIAEERVNVVSRMAAEASRLGELAQAVAAIAAHLTEDDASCPVCKTEFSKKSELRDRAMQQAVGTSVSMAALQEELQTAERNILYLQSKRQEFGAQVRAAEQDVSSLAAIAAQLAKRIASLRSAPLLEPPEGAEERLESAIADGEAEMASMSSSIEESPSENEIVVALSAARLVLTETTRDLDASRAQVAKLVAARSELLAKIDNARQSLEIGERSDSAEIVSHLAQNLATAEARRLSAAEAAYGAKAVHDVATQEVESARLTVDGVASEVVRADAELEAMRGHWKQAGLPDEPAEAAFQSAILSLTATQTALASSLTILAATAAGLEDWQRLDMTRQLEADLSTEAQGVALEEYGSALKAAVVSAKRQLAGARRAYAASEDLTAAVRAIGEDFGDSAIAPFGEVFKGFLRALVRDSRFHRVSPEYSRVRGGGNVLRFNLELEGASSSNDFEVEMVLSEGQLSEVSLAAMLAASCLYPWSRWRGVLLDDPTQYQDLTHSSSLFEVIRNLAMDAGFQVIVAVHDRAQADFLVRKLQSARVPYVECEYLAMGRHGAVTRVSGSLAR